MNPDVWALSFVSLCCRCSISHFGSVRLKPAGFQQTNTTFSVCDLDCFLRLRGRIASFPPNNPPWIHTHTHTHTHIHSCRLLSWYELLLLPCGWFSVCVKLIFIHTLSSSRHVFSFFYHRKRSSSSVIQIFNTSASCNGERHVSGVTVQLVCILTGEGPRCAGGVVWESCLERCPRPCRPTRKNILIILLINPSDSVGVCVNACPKKTRLSVNRPKMHIFVLIS